jgi:hypothetical protein
VIRNNRIKVDPSIAFLISHQNVAALREKEEAFTLLLCEFLRTLKLETLFGV